MPTLVIANKLYSSWSLRPWILMKAFGLPFDEVVLPLDTPEFRTEVARYSPAGRVPVLVDGDVTVWDSLAIAEYLAETHPDHAIWPRDSAARALARAISAEMHSGFQGLRSACPMNLGKRFAPRDRGEAAARDVERFTAIIRDARERFGADGPFLFGAFSAADAMYAPMATRLDTYSISVDPVSQAYIHAVLDHPAFRQWRDAALAETWIVDHDEVDEEPVEIYRAA
ncbi:MAG TPA: glutathione S-transferase family protein [Beijerinckiaceae bacterium]|jgi:glutathione S-transferase